MSPQWVAVLTTLAQVQSGLFIAYAVALKNHRANVFMRIFGIVGALTVAASVLALVQDAQGYPWHPAFLYFLGLFGMVSCSGMVGGLIGETLTSPRPSPRDEPKALDAGGATAVPDDQPLVPEKMDETS